MTTRVARQVKDPPIVAMFVGWLVLYFAVRMTLEAELGLSAGARLALSVAPAPVFAWFMMSCVRVLRGADELERRIQLEALAFAFAIGMLLLTTLGLVQRAVTLKFEDWSFNHVWQMFVVMYLAGMVVARRRYA